MRIVRSPGSPCDGISPSTEKPQRGSRVDVRGLEHRVGGEGGGLKHFIQHRRSAVLRLRHNIGWRVKIEGGRQHLRELQKFLLLPKSGGGVGSFGHQGVRAPCGSSFRGCSPPWVGHQAVQVGRASGGTSPPPPIGRGSRGAAPPPVGPLGKARILGRRCAFLCALLPSLMHQGRRRNVASLSLIPSRHAHQKDVRRVHSRDMSRGGSRGWAQRWVTRVDPGQIQSRIQGMVLG